MKKIALMIGVPLVLLMVVLVGAGVWGYFRFVRTTPLSEAELALLTPDWDVVTGGNWSVWVDAGDGTKEWNPAASYNAWVASVPEEEKAWPLMVEAYFAHEDYFQQEALVEHKGTTPADPERWVLLEPVLDQPEADAFLSKILEAFNRPVLGAGWSNHWDPYEHAALIEVMQSDPEAFDPGPLEFDPNANVSMMDMTMHWLGRHRSFVNFVESKAAYELEQGNTEGFVLSMEGMLRSSDLCKEIPTLIPMLVETAIEGVAIRTIDWGVTNHTAHFDAQSLERLENAVAQHANAEYFWQGESLQFHDTLRRLSDSSGKLTRAGVSSMQGGGGGLSTTPTSIPDTKLHASSQRMMYLYDKLLALSDTQSAVPWNGKSGQADAVFQKEKGSLNAIAAMLIDIMLPAIDHAAAKIRERTQETIGVRLGIAAHRHHLRHGAFPESIDAIDDDLLGFDPIDAFTSQPLGYIVTEQGPLVYSFGPDRLDNDGLQLWVEHTAWDDTLWYTKLPVEWVTPEKADSVYGAGGAMQGDWVLFPMPPDDPKPEEEEYDPDWDLKQGGNFNKESGAENAPESDG